MKRRLFAVALLVTFAACGNEAQVAELKSYVQSLRQFDDYNSQVEKLIVRFGDPTNQLTTADIAAARKLLEDYAAAVEALVAPDQTLVRNTHQLYIRTFGDARRLANDATGDTKRQAHSVAIGLRRLRTAIQDRVYPSLDVLLAREKLTGPEYKLAWPEDE